jgi:alcohol dehydrogenase
VLGRPDDVAAWGRMLLGSYLAGAAIEHSMLGAAHACANPLTARFPVTHGAAVGLFLPHVVRFNAERAGRLYDELLRLCSVPATSLPDRICQLLRAAQLPERLSDCGVPRDRLPELAEEAERQWTAAFNPRPVTGRELLEIHEAAY